MTNTLFTFLGRPAQSERGEYRRTTYDFGGGEVAEPAVFFGWPLAMHLRSRRVVVLGTSGSAWDHVVEGDFQLGAEAEDARLALDQAVRGKAVTAALLEPLEAPLGARLGLDVCLRLIPYCRDEGEQAALLGILAEHVGDGDVVHVDVTHGFRTLPMLALLAALYLRRVRHARIDGIWYGAFDPDTGAAPVQNLKGLLEISDWLEALAVYDHSGDYGPVGRVLGDRRIGEQLEAAAFREQINDFGAARGLARNVLKSLDEAAGLSPSFGLFRGEIERRLQWAEKGQFYQRQRQLALERLAHGQFDAAILAGQEAFVSRLLQRTPGYDPYNPEHRQSVRDAFEQEQRRLRPRSELFKAWEELTRLRNAIAHGSRGKGESVQRALGGPAAMGDFLERVFAVLLESDADAGNGAA